MVSAAVCSCARGQRRAGASLACLTGVECRIQIQRQADGCTIQLAGRLNAEQVHELHSVCAAATGRLRIDLTDLLSADAVGLDSLRRLRLAGAEIIGAARYLRRWVM